MSDPTELELADEYCRALVRRHYENFVAVSAFVRGRQARDLMRIYAYCRTTDDLGDEGADNRLERLQRWHDEVVGLFAGAAPLHPVLVALRETVKRCRIGQQPFVDLIAANIQDQTVSSYESWPQLRAYCELSAAPVGRMVLPVFGLTEPKAAVSLSDDVCIGLQLANHAQDVQRDAARGRCYLVQSELREGGSATAVRSLCDRARELLASGIELERLAPYAYRVQLMLYRLGGAAIVDAIARQGYTTDRHRPHVTATAKLLMLLRACLASLREERHAKRLETA